MVPLAKIMSLCCYTGVLILGMCIWSRAADAAAVTSTTTTMASSSSFCRPMLVMGQYHGYDCFLSLDSDTDVIPKQSKAIRLTITEVPALHAVLPSLPVLELMEMDATEAGWDDPAIHVATSHAAGETSNIHRR